MTQQTNIENLPIIEVPPELRGLSNEEILALHPVDEKKNDRFRPSKKEREARKIAKEQERIRQIAAQYKNRDEISHYSRPMPKMSDFEGNRQTRNTERPLPSHKKTLFVPGQMKKLSTPEPVLTPKPSVAPLPAQPSSGRVLVGSFSGAKFGAAKTEIISTEELAKKRAEEEAKRQREIVRKHLAEAALAAQKAALAAVAAGAQAENGEPKTAPDLASLFKPGSALAVAGAAAAAAGVSLPPMQIGPDGKPVLAKRKRGRPRKYPRPEDLIV